MSKIIDFEKCGTFKAILVKKRPSMAILPVLEAIDGEASTDVSRIFSEEGVEVLKPETNDTADDPRNIVVAVIILIIGFILKKMIFG